MEERIRDSLNVADEESANGVELNDDGDDDEFFDAEHAKDGEETGASVDFVVNDDNDDENDVLETMVSGHKGRFDFDENDGNDDDVDDDEIGVLEAMLAGRKSRKPSASTHKPEVSETPTQIESENENDGVGAMEYNNRKPAKKKRRAKKEKGGKNGDETNVPTNGKYEKNVINIGDGDSYAQESSSQYFEENEDNAGKENEQVGRDKKKISNQPVDKKGTSKNTKPRSKLSTRGRKPNRNLGHFCETCEEEFESRNKLHKHLSDSGHAAMKSR